jgi:hypothetical protein
MKKPKYKEVARKNQWVVVANYQPGNMWMTSEDTKRSRHPSLHEAMQELEKHQKAGASDIEIYQSFLCMEMKP